MANKLLGEVLDEMGTTSRYRYRYVRPVNSVCQHLPSKYLCTSIIMTAITIELVGQQ